VFYRVSRACHASTPAQTWGVFSACLITGSCALIRLVAVRWSCKDCNRLDPRRVTDMTKVVLQMRAALAKEAALRKAVSPGSRMGDFGQDAGGMVDPDDDYEDEWSPPPAADNENDADAGAVAGLASNARSVPKELDEVSQACREHGEATANDEESEMNGASQPPRLRKSDLVSMCEADVARSFGTKGVAAAVVGASSAAGSGRGPRHTNVLFKDVFDTTYLASAKILYRMERIGQRIGRCHLEFSWVSL